jgi:hypothetical protein
MIYTDQDIFIAGFERTTITIPDYFKVLPISFGFCLQK